MLRDTAVIYRKELKSYFVSALVYAIFTVMFIISGILFYSILSNYLADLPGILSSPLKDIRGFDELVLQQFFRSLSAVLIIILPLLSMRIFAEENRSGTLELLLTSPVSQFSVITGKFLAIMTVYFVLLLVLCSFFMILAPYAPDVIDFGQLGILFLGYLLFGGSLLSFGIFASSLTRSQLVAALLAFAFNFVFLIIKISSYYFVGWKSTLLARLSLDDHLQTFLKGILDTRDILYFVSLIIFMLILTNVSIDSRRWGS